MEYALSWSTTDSTVTGWSRASLTCSSASRRKHSEKPFASTRNATSQTQTYEPSGDGMTVTVETIAGNGARIVYGYTANLDGKEYPVTGELTPNGAETIAVNELDAFTIEATLRKAGEMVLTTTSVISKDGKMLTLRSRGTNVSEQPTNSVTVFDKAVAEP